MLKNAVTRTRVDFFYDVVSPYTWFGFEVLTRYRPHWNMHLNLKPFYLGGVMKSTGNRPPMMVPAKGLYMSKDLVRNAKYFDVPLHLISDPFETMVTKGTLRTQRFLTAIQLNYPNHLEEVSRQLWMRIWSRDEDVTSDDSLLSAAKTANMGEEEIKQCLKLIDNLSIKEHLKNTTEEAVEQYGAFGSPTIVVHTSTGPEIFMGSDRFPIIASVMNEQWKGPLPNKED